MSKQKGITPQAYTAMTVAGVALIGFSGVFSVLSSINLSDLTTVSLTLHASLHFFPQSFSVPSRAAVAISSIAWGMFLTLVGLQGDGCDSD